MTFTVTRVAHACVVLDFAGRRLLTDPWFSERRGYYRGEPLAFTWRSPRIVCRSWLESWSATSTTTTSTWPPSPPTPDHEVPFVVKRGLAAPVRQAGFPNVIEVDQWEQASLCGLRVTAAPARHSVPDVSFVVEGAGQSVFFGGDTLRIAELDEVALRYPRIDLALLPVNGLAIRPALNRQVVMTAEEAAELAAVLKARLPDRSGTGSC